MKLVYENEAEQVAIEELQEHVDAYIKSLRRCFLARVKFGDDSEQLKKAEAVALDAACLVAGKLAYELHPTRMLDIIEAPGLGLDDDVLEEMNKEEHS